MCTGFSGQFCACTYAQDDRFARISLLAVILRVGPVALEAPRQVAHSVNLIFGFGTNGAYASVRARIGDTRRILDLRTSGEAAEWCGAHIASTRRRMDRASTVAPSSRASTVETIETDEMN